MTTLSARIAAHAAQTPFEAVPTAAIEAAKRSLLDAIGVSLGASGLEPSCAPFIDLALAAGGAPQSTILGVGAKAPAAQAAFANGALAHAIDFEDAYDPAPTHPNAALIPAVLALAEARGGVSGKELLAAIAVGCDLVCRLALCVRTQPDKLGWYPPPIFGAYGAVAGAGRVLGLSAEQMRDAFSLALFQVSTSNEIIHNPQSSLRAVREAFPAHAAVVSAQLAARGVTGFVQPFEGKAGFFRLFAAGDYDERRLLDGLGERFLGADLSYKPWPSCRGTHAYIEMALAMRGKDEIAPAQIEAITLRGGALQQILMQPVEAKRAPTTAIDAKFSLPFTVATAFVRGGVTLTDFAPDALRAEDIRALARVVEYEMEEGLPAAGGAMQVRLRDGRTLSGAIEEALGAARNPISWNDLVRKAQSCADYARRPAPPDAIARLADIVSRVDESADAALALQGSGAL